MTKVFIDASVFFSACYSQDGASFEIFRLGLTGDIQLITSEYVLLEVVRNLARKAPEALGNFEEFRRSVPFEMVNPDRAEVLEAAQYTELKDAPIVAAALKAEVDFLVSLDRRHLVGQGAVTQGSGLQILLPESFIRQLRNQAGNT